ncbi:MAG: peroxiredoxin family protein [Stenotrophobium sp.]
MLRARSILLFALCLLLPAAAWALNIGEPAPDFSASLLDGGRFKLADHRGDVVILNFWATWCVPCRSELPAFGAYLHAHQGEGLDVIAVSMDDPEDLRKVHDMAATLPFPAAMYDAVKADAYGRIWRLPITFVIDRGGLLRIDGGQGERQAYDLPGLERAIDPLLREPRPVQKE